MGRLALPNARPARPRRRHLRNPGRGGRRVHPHPRPACRLSGTDAGADHLHQPPRRLLQRALVLDLPPPDAAPVGSPPTARGLGGRALPAPLGAAPAASPPHRAPAPSPFALVGRRGPGGAPPPPGAPPPAGPGRGGARAPRGGVLPGAQVGARLS